MDRKGEWGENLPPKFGVLDRDKEEEGTGTVGKKKRAQGRQEIYRNIFGPMTVMVLKN